MGLSVALSPAARPSIILGMDSAGLAASLCRQIGSTCVRAGATAQAATMTAAFSPTGPTWQVQLVLTNDGAPAQIGHFTLYFDESLFSGLALLQSPSGWDSVLVQPDTAIPARGFLDAGVRAPKPPLALGQYSTAYAPDLGFVPLATKLDANGIHAVAADAGYGSATAQLRSKLAQLTQFLNQAPGTDAADSAALVQFQVELAAIASTLRSPAARPSVYGVVQHGDAISDLLAKDMPLLLKALAARTQAQANLPPSAGRAAVGTTRPAAALGAGSSTDGAISGVIGKLGPIGELVVAIYGDYLDQLENMIIIMLINHLLDAHLPQSISIHGVLSGAALLGPYAYHYPNSYIDMDGLSLAAAQNADVYLIGGAAVNAVREAIAQRPAGGEITIQGIYDLLDRIATILSTAYQAAHQQPAYVITNSFSENFGCLPSLSDFCIEMHYPNGFENVSGGSVSFTVLMLIRSNGPQPQYGIKLLSFAPGT